MSYRFSRACITVWLVLIGTGISAQTPAPARVPVPAPDHCIVGESVFGCVSASAVAEIIASGGKADELKEKIAADFRAVAADGSIAERLKATGQAINIGGPKEFAESIDEQRRTVAATAKAIDYKPKN